MRKRLLPTAAGILLALAMPTLASAHEITNVDVDCDGEAIHITGKMFGQEGGATITVTGPDGYLQSFFADQDDEWTVTLPLGPDGAYVIDWPNSGDRGPVNFEVDCVEAAVLPTEAPAPTDEPEGPEGEVLAEAGTNTGRANPTLPPTDALASGPDQAGDSDLAGLALFGLAAATIWAAMTSLNRRTRTRGDDGSA